MLTNAIKIQIHSTAILNSTIREGVCVLFIMALRELLRDPSSGVPFTRAPTPRSQLYQITNCAGLNASGPFPTRFPLP